MDELLIYNQDWGPGTFVGGGHVIFFYFYYFLSTMYRSCGGGITIIGKARGCHIIWLGIQGDQNSSIYLHKNKFSAPAPISSGPPSNPCYLLTRSLNLLSK